MLYSSFYWKLHGDADLILEPVHTVKGTKSWFNSNCIALLYWLAWPERHSEPIGHCQEEDVRKPNIKIQMNLEKDQIKKTTDFKSIKMWPIGPKQLSLGKPS